MGASQSQQPEPTRATASQLSPTHTAAHQTVSTTADKAHSAIDTVATTAEQAKQRLHETDEQARRRAEDVKRTLQQKQQQAAATVDELKQRAAAMKDELKQTAQQTTEEARQRVGQAKERLLEATEKKEREVTSVWQQMKDNIRQRYDVQYRCPSMEELQSVYESELRFRPLPMHRLLVKSPNLLSTDGRKRATDPSLQLGTVSTAEHGDMLLGQLTYGGVRSAAVDGLKPISAARYEQLRGEVVVDVPTDDWRSAELYTDNTWTTDNIAWRSQNSARGGDYCSVTHMHSPLAAFTFRWDYRKQFHSVTSSLSSTLYHDPLTSTAVTAALSAKSEPFNSATLAVCKPGPDVLSAVVHYRQPQYMADVQAAYHPTTAQLHSYAARTVFRSSPLGVYPHCKVGVMLSDQAVLSVGRTVSVWDAVRLWDEDGGRVDAGCYRQPVLSSCVAYSPNASVDLKCYVASSGTMGVMMQREDVAPRVAVEVSAVGDVLARNKVSVGVGVTVG